MAVADRLARLARAIERRLGPARQSLDMGSLALERGVRQRIERQRGALSGFAGRLEALSPLATLSRGYSVARTPEGGVLRSADDFSAGMRFHLRLTDGTVAADAVGPIESEGTDG